MAKSTSKTAAKKTATKKKAAPPVKAKADKPKKPVKPAKVTKAVKPEKAVVKTKAKELKSSKAPQKEKVVDAEPTTPLKLKKTPIIPKITDPSKAKTVVSILEADPVQGDSKVEKVSKVKPVKVDRGNAADEKAKWLELNKKYGKDKAVTYKMTESYGNLQPLQHKVLGWGFILTNENDRLEVLFESGIRMLISNYKS